MDTTRVAGDRGSAERAYVDTLLVLPATARTDGVVRMQHGVRFTVLGPMRVCVGGREVGVSAVRERTLLAMLVLHANDFVPRDRLIDAIWGDRPPQNARNQVQGCVSRLRRRLSRVGADNLTVVTGPEGYALRSPPGGADVLEFRRLLAEARAAAASGEAQAARDRYRAALGLWRGPAAAGVESVVVRGAASGLDDERVQAWEEYFEVELALGGGAELVPDLTDLAGRYPYRERLHGCLLRALCRAGRHADALNAYQGLRQLLRDELGVDPGAELQRLHRAILNRDPMLDPPDGARPFRTGPPVPRQLPAEASCFVGREAELAQLHDVVAPAVAQAYQRATVVLVYGPGGTGKSALAVRAGHQLANEFPDGQLYADLLGSTPGMRPLPPVELLGRFLRSLGVPPAEVPVEEAEAVSLFRSTIVDRRLLLVLDNAASRDQVIGLMPSAPGCAVVITSRQPLPALDTDARLRLDPLPDPDARALLAGVAAAHTMTPETAQRIATYTGGLPLALRIVAGRLASRPDLSADEYAARLSDRSRRLDELQLDDFAVRACIRTGYDALLCGGGSVGQLAARAFRALGLLQVPTVAPDVVAAMLAEPNVDHVRVALDRLVDAQLLEPARSGRYRLHDLVRLVAAERATVEDESAECEQVLLRAIASYTSTLCSADEIVRSGGPRPFGDLPTSQPSLVRFDGPARVRMWLDEELPTLVAVITQMLGGRDDVQEYVLLLAQAMWNSLNSRCEWQVAYRMSKLLVDAAEIDDDPQFAGWAYLLHGRSEECLGNHESATVHLQHALKCFRRSGSVICTTLTLNALGIVDNDRGRPSGSLRHFGEALSLGRRNGLEGIEALVLSNMSVSFTLLGQVDRAVTVGEEALATIGMDDRNTSIGTMINLAGAYSLRGDQLEAMRRADAAFALSQEAGDRLRQCEVLVIRSEANRRLGHLAEALSDAYRARSIARESGYRFVVAAALHQAARLLREIGRASEAEEAQVQAAEIGAFRGLAYGDPLINLVLADAMPSRPDA